MGDQLSIYRALVNENAPAFKSQITWYANGKRGHLHSSSTCTKLRRVGTITITLDLRSALADRTVCGECITWGSFDQDQRDSVGLARRIMESLRNSENAPSAPFKGRPVVTAARNHRYRAGIADGLRREVNLCGMDEWVKRVIDGIDAETPPMPPIDALHEECVRIAAPHVLQKWFFDNSPDPALWGGTEVVRILNPEYDRGYVPYRQKTPLSFFTTTWLEKLHEGMTPQEANSLLLADGAIVHLLAEPDKQQLDQCQVVLDRSDGETLWQFTVRNWKTQVLAAFNVAAEAMSTSHAALVAPAAPVLVGHNTQSPDAIRRQSVSNQVEQIIGGLQTLVGNGERSVAVCHPTVARFLVGNSSYGGWSGPVALDGGVSQDELETVVALWEPRNRYSSYEKLSAALEAARAL